MNIRFFDSFARRCFLRHACMCCKFASHLGFRASIHPSIHSLAPSSPSDPTRPVVDPHRPETLVLTRRRRTDRRRRLTRTHRPNEYANAQKCPRRARAPTTARPRPRRRRRHPFFCPRASCRDASSSTSTRLGARFLVACARDSTSGRGERRRRVRVSTARARARDVRDADAMWKRCDGSFVHEASVTWWLGRFFDATGNEPTD